MKEKLGYVQIEYDLIKRLHVVRNKKPEKMFLKDVVRQALTEFLERNEK